MSVPLGEVIRLDNLRSRGCACLCWGRGFLFDHAITSTPRTRRSSTIPDSATTTTITNSERIQGVSYFGGSRKMTSPTCARFAENEIHDMDVLRVTA